MIQPRDILLMTLGFLIPGLLIWLSNRLPGSRSSWRRIAFSQPSGPQ
jgi:hypothetical protein